MMVSEEATGEDLWADVCASTFTLGPLLRYERASSLKVLLVQHTVE